MTRTHACIRGFTLIELMIVMSIIALLLTLAIPRYFVSVEKSKEVVLRENLRTTRDAIDKFFADNGHYPESLETLAKRRYLRAVPIDPITGNASTWVPVPAPGAIATLYDIKSGAQGAASDGTAYADW